MLILLNSHSDRPKIVALPPFVRHWFLDDHQQVETKSIATTEPRMSSDSEIIAKVARRAADPARRIDGEFLAQPPRPLDNPNLLVELERELGFALPDLLKALYLQVGDGGFGPGYGLFGAYTGHYLSDEPFTLAQLYQNALQARRLNGSACGWRAGMLPICEWGCDFRDCIDCSDSNYGVFLSEFDERLVAFHSQHVSFRDWIEAWADGIDVTPKRG